MTDQPDPQAQAADPEQPESSPRRGPPDGTHLRVIKSYVLRAGRTTLAQARAYEHHGPRFLLEYAPRPLDAAAAFGREAPLIVEIGFGQRVCRSSK